MSIIRTICYVFCAVLTLLLTVILIRTFTLEVAPHEHESTGKSQEIAFISATDDVIDRFRTALRCKTVSTEKHGYDRKELSKLVNFIKTAFPKLHSSSLVQHEVVANYSLLFHVKGSNSVLTPFLLMSHLDVVPAEPTKWDAPPFDAEIRDGFIYARGTIDFKHGIMSRGVSPLQSSGDIGITDSDSDDDGLGIVNNSFISVLFQYLLKGIMEALEYLISSGHKPHRSFYVAFGHDEEVGGEDGAAAISSLLWERGVHNLEFVVDEGLTVVNKVIPGIDIPVALVGSSEKGQVYLKLYVEGKAGHSSMPAAESPIGILANAVARLEKFPQPSMFGYGPEKETFEHIAPFMKPAFRVVMSNLWLFGPLVSWVLSWKPSTNAVVRTVTAVTMFNAGIKINVNAPDATAYVNHRVHPAQTIEHVIDYDKRVINDDRVKIEAVYRLDPLPISPCGPDDFGFQIVKNSIKQVWTEAVVAPGTMIGNTDTRHYTKFSNNIYRFSPTFMYPDDIPRFHGDNERISVKNYEQAINFYYRVMMNADIEKLPPHHKHGEL